MAKQPDKKPDLSLHDVGDVRNIEGVVMPEALANPETLPQVNPWQLGVRREPQRAVVEHVAPAEPAAPKRKAKDADSE